MQYCDEHWDALKEGVEAREYAWEWRDGWDYAAGQTPELRLLFSIPNGGHRHRAVAGKMKAEGVKKGVPDLFLPVARNGFHGLFIEMKTVRGRVRAEQAAWHAALRSEGYAVKVCFGFDAARHALTEYLEMEP